MRSKVVFYFRYYKVYGINRCFQPNNNDNVNSKLSYPEKKEEKAKRLAITFITQN